MGPHIPNIPLLDVHPQDTKPPKSPWTDQSEGIEHLEARVEFLRTFVIDTRPRLPMWGCGLQGWVVRLWWKSDVCV